MNQQIERSLEIKKQSTFQQRIDAITGRQLRPEIIDSYADEALEDLIETVMDVVKAYEARPGITGQSDRETERAAFMSAGLNPDDIESTLDHIAAVAEHIHRLDDVIEQTSRRIDAVITPPYEIGRLSGDGTGQYERKQLIPRLKTLLFLLEKEFDIDLNDQTEIRITKGAVTESMMRHESYNLVEIPVADRIVLVCDEEGNATFVFDAVALDSLGVSSAGIAAFSKSQLAELIETHPVAGRRIVYSPDFVPALLTSIKEPLTSPHEGESKEQPASYLRRTQQAPEGYISITGMREKLRVGKGVLARAIRDIGDELGEVQTYTFRTRIARGYSPEQQELIEGYLSDTILVADDGVATVTRLAKELGIGYETLVTHIEEVSDKLGEIKKYRFGENNKPALGYTAAQQRIIADHLRNIGKYNPPPPEGIVPISGLMEQFGRNLQTIKSAIEALGEELGPVRQYRFHSANSDGFDQEQQAKIRAYLTEQGKYGEERPEGYMTPSMFSKACKISIYPVQDAIETLGESLGAPGKYIVRGRLTECYDPAQLDRIHQYLKDKGTLAEAAPEGYVSLSSFSRTTGINYNTIRKAVVALGDDFGEMKKYQHKGQYTERISPAQQSMLLAYLGRDPIASQR